MLSKSQISNLKSKILLKQGGFIQHYLFFQKKDSAGFTLMELLVVLTIATIVITSIVIQQDKWNDRLAVNTQAYELALAIRQAQVYSLGVRENPSGGADKFEVGYGVYFNKSNTYSASDPSQQSSYILFADRNKNKTYDSGEAIGDPVALKRRVVISKFCGFSGGNERCSDESNSVVAMHISFYRPETRAFINILNTGGNPTADAPAKIYLRSPAGKQFVVSVADNGQVSMSEI